MSNRIAWSVKLASMGIPVVLIYLGCLNAKEVYKNGDPIFTKQEELENMNNHLEIEFEVGEKKISIECYSDDDTKITYVNWVKLVEKTSKEVLLFEDWGKAKEGKLPSETKNVPARFYLLIRTIDIQLEDKPIEAKIYING